MSRYGWRREWSGARWWKRNISRCRIGAFPYRNAQALTRLFSRNIFFGNVRIGF
jgi:hypothetical protein